MPIPWIADELRFAPGVELLGATATADDVRQAMMTAFPASMQYFRDPTTMLATLQPEVLVVLETGLHSRKLAEAAVQMGCHCLLAAPLGVGRADATALMALARRASVEVMVHAPRLWDPPLAELLRRAARGAVGEIYELAAVVATADRGDTDDPRSPAAYQDGPGSDATADATLDLIVCALTLLGRPKTVFARSIAAVDPAGRGRGMGWRSAWLVLGYERAAAILRTSVASAHSRNELMCLGSEGSLVTRSREPLIWSNAPPTIDVPSRTRKIPTSGTPAERRRPLAHLVHSIRTGTRVARPHTAAIHAEAAQIYDSVVDSIASGEPLRIDGETP